MDNQQFAAVLQGAVAGRHASLSCVPGEMAALYSFA